MTQKDFINKVMDIATEQLRNGNHEAYSKCIDIIAREMARTYFETEEKEEA